jgi:prepilin-type N-terminal cleavage/methylation domain-containing protein
MLKTMLKGRRGFTLLELMVVLAIMSMVIGMSIPAFSSYIRGSRLRSAAREISSTIMLARTQAITLREERAVMFRSAQRDFGIGGGEEGHLLPPGVVFVLARPEVIVELTSTGRAVDEHGNPASHTITIFSDGNNNGVRDAGEAQIEIRVGALGHVTIE